MIIFDADFVGMSVLPSKGDAILLVDPNAVPTGLIAFQPLQPVDRGDHQIVQAPSGVKQFQFSLDDTPFAHFRIDQR